MNKGKLVRAGRSAWAEAPAAWEGNRALAGQSWGQTGPGLGKGGPKERGS